MDELVAEAVDRCRHQAGTKQITMAAGGTADLRVWGNRGQLAAALGNLVENAVNYSPARTRVGIAARRVSAPGGDLVEISVTDQGIGISDKDQERIFERFYRVDPARSRATGGTGPRAGDRQARGRLARRRGHRVERRGPGLHVHPAAAEAARPATARSARTPGLDDVDGRHHAERPSPRPETHPPRRSFRDPSARRRGRGVLHRRPVLHAPQGGLRGRHRDHRARRRSTSSSATAPTSSCST